jgi:hypothetical protein
MEFRSVSLVTNKTAWETMEARNLKAYVTLHANYLEGVAPCQSLHSMLKALGLIPSTKTKQEFKIKVYWGEDRHQNFHKIRSVSYYADTEKVGTVELKSTDGKKHFPKEKAWLINDLTVLLNSFS